jgi:hypothetical protein
MTTRYKVAELEGAMLDLSVARALGIPAEIEHEGWMEGTCWSPEAGRFSPSTDWSIGGPLVDEHWISIDIWLTRHMGVDWSNCVGGAPGELVRWFMRALVASKLGDEVEL